MARQSKGWDLGVKGMRVGDKRKLVILPDMGYGKKGAPGTIPPSAWLEFDRARSSACSAERSAGCDLRRLKCKRRQ